MMAMAAHDVVAILDEVPAADLAAPALLGRLGEMEQAGQLSSGVLVQLGPEIETATEELRRHARKSREVVKRCQELAPMPAQFVPPGF